jgi:hypothetical protein
MYWLIKKHLCIGSEAQARGGKCDPCYSSPCLNGGFCITEDNAVQPRLSRAFRYCPASPGHSGYCPASPGHSGTVQCTASPGHSGTVQPLQDIQVLSSISRTFRYCPASSGHLGTGQPFQDIQVLPCLSRAFRYCPACPGHSGTVQPLQDIQV